FKNGSVNEVSDSLIRFSALMLKMNLGYYHHDKAGNLVIGRKNASDSGRNIIFDKEVVLNHRKIGLWSSIRRDTSLLYNLPELTNFTNDEKRQLWSIFSFLVTNEINGAHSHDSTIFFPFKQHPFANRHDMYIIFEDDFNQLNEKEKKFMLDSQLIIDKKAELLLIIGDKGRFLRYVYGRDEDVPKKWQQPTTEAFRIP